MPQMKVVGLGEILFDLLPSGPALGGAPVNFAYHASSLGCNAVAMSAIGNDKLGEEVTRQLLAKGLPHLLEKVDRPTGTVNVAVDRNGIPSYEITRDVAWDFIPFSQQARELASGCVAVCFGSLAQRNPVSRDTINSFLDAMPQGSLKVFDINLRQKFYSKDIIINSLCKANVLKINDEELVILRGMANLSGDDVQVGRKLMEDYGLKYFILTRGTKGSMVLSEDVVSDLPTPKVNVVDTVGAGDSFTAAFVAGILSGASIAEAHSMAVERAALVCSLPGAMPEI